MHHGSRTQSQKEHVLDANCSNQALRVLKDHKSAAVLLQLRLLTASINEPNQNPRITSTSSLQHWIQTRSCCVRRATRTSSSICRFQLVLWFTGVWEQQIVYSSDTEVVNEIIWEHKLEMLNINANSFVISITWCIRLHCDRSGCKTFEHHINLMKWHLGSRMLAELWWLQDATEQICVQI